MNAIDNVAYLSTKQAASELGMNVKFIRDEIKRGFLPALKMSKREYRISKEDWENYKKSKQTA